MPYRKAHHRHQGTSQEADSEQCQPMHRALCQYWPPRWPTGLRKRGPRAYQAMPTHGKKEEAHASHSPTTTAPASQTCLCAASSSHERIHSAAAYSDGAAREGGKAAVQMPRCGAQTEERHTKMTEKMTEKMTMKTSFVGEAQPPRPPLRGPKWAVGGGEGWEGIASVELPENCVGSGKKGEENTTKKWSIAKSDKCDAQNGRLHMPFTESARGEFGRQPRPICLRGSANNLSGLKKPFFRARFSAVQFGGIFGGGVRPSDCGRSLSLRGQRGQ